MRLSLNLSALILAQALVGDALPQGRVVEERATTEGPQFTEGQPIDGKGKGAPILGMLSCYILRLSRQTLQFNMC